MDHCVGDQIRRQEALSDEVLRWLHLHETLEMDHADDSRDLALLVPDDAGSQRAVETGARAQWNALWGFLTDVHALVEPSR
jgi:pyrroloquinoline quinone (PQQ) biosynthesis protein C